jgi:hypothetical protein
VKANISSDLSFIGENYKKSPRIIMLISPNDKMLDFNFCSFRCIVTSKIQLIIDILSIIIN